MYTLIKDNIIIIPLAYNIFLDDCNKNQNSLRFNQDNNLSKDLIDQLYEYIDTADIEYNILINMQYISSYTSRAFKIFKYLSNEKNIIFYNLLTNIKSKILEDVNLNNDHTLNNVIYFMGQRLSIERINEISDNITKFNITQIINSTINNGTQFLESSSVYSNMYVDLKKLFINVDQYTFIIYKLAELVQNDFSNADALISSSKTGAVISNLIGQLIDKKTIHCLGIGPKFALSIERLKNGVK